MAALLSFFKRQWFLTTLAILIAVGMTAGAKGEAASIEPWIAWLHPKGITSAVVFLMAFSLDSGRLGAAFRSPGPVVVGFCMNYGLVPLLAWALMPLQMTADFRYGLMIAASVPCTLAAASVMTRQAKGNDAVSLLVTLSSNMLCFLITPFWLYVTTATSVKLDPQVLMRELLLFVLIPTTAGQLLRQPRRIRAFVDRHKMAFSISAQILIELTVLTAALRAGKTLHESTQGITAESVLVVWGCCIAVHLISLVCGLYTARGLGFAASECAPVAFAGSQKTLPIGLYIASDPTLFGAAYPFALFPMLLFHASQLFLDTIVAGKLARRVTG